MKAVCINIAWACLALSACGTPQVKPLVDERTQLGQNRVQEVNPVFPQDPQVKGGALYANQAAREQVAPKVMKSASKSWVGSVMIPANADDKLPAAFSQDYVLNFSDGRTPMSLPVVLSRLGQVVGMPIRVNPDVFAGNPAASALDGGSSLLVTGINWQGSLSTYLDYLTDQFGLSWEYRDGGIVVMRFVTEMYELATFPNSYTYTLNSGASGTASGEGVQSNSQLNVAEQGALNSQRSLVELIKKMVDSVPGSEVLLAEGSGRLMVKSSKEVQARVRDVIRTENNNMLRQVQIQLDVYSVTSNNDNELGVDWTAFYRSLQDSFGLSATSPASLVGQNAGTVTARILQPLSGANSETANRFANSAAIVRALSELGTSVQHRPISLVALNRQWARKARLTTTGYLSETRPAPASPLGGGAGVPGLTTDSVTTGDQYSVMPFILENNTVMLKMGMSLSDLLGLFDVTTGAGETLQRVQTPNTSSISDQYTIALRPGEVMAITGLSRDVSDNRDRRLADGASIALGGSRVLSLRRENFVVFVRAVLL
ncbi:MAG TPA: hypothetical protein VFV39_07485 [Limnobacter sp.]|nr:hypothetical protein [Limnobacter sp.]